MALGIILLYFICWFFAKRLPAFILVAFIIIIIIIIIIDSLLLIGLILVSGFETAYLLDIAFHGWILLRLVSGVAAWTKLRHVNPNDLKAALPDNITVSP